MLPSSDNRADPSHEPVRRGFKTETPDKETQYADKETQYAASRHHHRTEHSPEHATTVLAPNRRRPCGRPRRIRRPEPLGHACGVGRRWPSRVHPGDAE